MTRSLALAWLVLGVAAIGCGRYGPPERTLPPPGASQPATIPQGGQPTQPEPVVPEPVVPDAEADDES